MATNGGPYLSRLDPEDCVGHLATTDIGRLGLTIGAMPAIRPVRYSLLGSQLVFRAPAGSHLHKAAAGKVIAFQADDSGDLTGVGWTVHLVGLCDEVTSPDLIQEMDLLPLPAWHRSGIRDAWLRLPLDHITGERIYW